MPPPTQSEARLAVDLRRHVKELSHKIGPRNTVRPGKLEEAAQYIEGFLSSHGFETESQPFKVGNLTVRNVVAELPGRRVPDEIIVIGAHYDSIGQSPGADDNASGVAGLLEIARAFASRRFDRTIRFVGFVNEEPPFFQTENMGSVHYAQKCRRDGDDVVAMLSLEMLGYFVDEPESQRYPFPFSLYYPSTGNFLGFVGDSRSAELTRAAVETFRYQTLLPAEGAAAPGWITGIGWSDQWAFWQEGYRGLMVTDTALFRNPNYHRTSDTYDTLDYERMARVVRGVSQVIQRLANRPLPRPLRGRHPTAG